MKKFWTVLAAVTFPFTLVCLMVMACASMALTAITQVVIDRKAKNPFDAFCKFASSHWDDYGVFLQNTTYEKLAEKERQQQDPQLEKAAEASASTVVSNVFSNKAIRVGLNHIPVYYGIKFLYADLKECFGLAFVAINGEPQKAGLRFDACKRAFMDGKDMPMVSRAIEASKDEIFNTLSAAAASALKREKQ